jgi:hypothetical protein
MMVAIPVIRQNFFFFVLSSASLEVAEGEQQTFPQETKNA